jgi:hypothetical protein
MGIAQNKLNAIGGEQVAEWIADGRSYRDIARTVEVGLGRLCHWIDADPERSQACARARENSAQSFEDQAQEHIENAVNQFELSKAKELAIHLRWRAKVNNPKRYGDKVQTELSGSLSVKKDAANMTDEELHAVIRGRQT